MASGSGRMSWEEVCIAYPDEWVIMNDLDYDASTSTLRGGTVIAHGPTRKAMLASVPRIGPESRAIQYTGRINVELYEALRMVGLAGGRVR